MLIVTEYFTELATSGVEASSEAATMPASRLRELQPSRRWRGTTISDTPWIQANLWASDPRPPLGYDLVAVIGYDGAPSRNMHRSAVTLAGWTKANNVVPQTYAAIAPPSAIAAVPVEITADASAATYIEQTLDKPGKGSDLNAAALSLRSSILVRQNAGDDLDLRIIAYSTISTQEARVDFDLSAGTAGTESAAGAWTADAASITDLGDDWYLCTLEYTTDTADTLTVRFQMLDAGATTITSGDILVMAAPATLLQTAESVAEEYPVTGHTGTGPMFQVRVGHDLTGTETTAARSGWLHAASRNEFRGFGRYSFYHQFSAQRSEPEIRVELWDPHNTNAYLEAGRVIVGKVADLTGKLMHVSLDAEEKGGQIEADGGQIYRPQNAVRRRISLRFEYLTKAEAMDDVYRIQRERGRSRQVLLIAPEWLESGQTARYTQEHMIYGYIDRLEPVPIMSDRIPSRWRWGFTVVETL